MGGGKADVQRGDHPAACVQKRHRNGAQADLDLLVDDGVAIATDTGNLVEQGLGIGQGMGRARGKGRAGQQGQQIGLGQGRQQDAAHRGAIGWQTRPRHQRNRHDLLLRRARHIDDLGPVEDRDGAAFPDLFGQAVQPGLDDLRQRHGRKAGRPQPQDARRQGKELAVVIRIAVMGQRQQAAPRRRPVQPRSGRNRADGLAWAVGGEGLDHPQALGQPAHHVALIETHDP